MTETRTSEPPIPPRERAAQVMERIRSVGGRRTAFRAVVLEVLADAAPEHLTATEVHQRLSAAGWPVDISGVYRALLNFAGWGVAHTLATSGTTAYGLSDPLHHHAICDRCAIVTEIPVETLHAAATAAERSTGFRPAPDGVTLNGLCARCRLDSLQPALVRTTRSSQRPPPRRGGRGGS